MSKTSLTLHPTDSGSRGFSTQVSQRRTSNTSSGTNIQLSQVNCDLRYRSRSSQWPPESANYGVDDDPHDLYLGDIYARRDRPFDCFLITQAEHQEKVGTYHQHIREISRGWYHLRYLADFMTVSTVPLRWRHIKTIPGEREERLNRVSISVIEYGDEMDSKDLKSRSDLETFLQELSDPKEAQKNRLLVVQDLSTLMIEMLGMAFDVPPGFFRSHIGDYVWLNTRDPQAEIPDLESFSRTSSHFSAQYVQPRYFENQSQLDAAKAQAESFNVLRRIDNDGRFKPWSDMPGSDVGLVRSKVSLWVRPTTSENQPWLGILLVDPQITHGFPLWSGYGNFHPPPSVETDRNDITFPKYGSQVNEFVHWTLNQANSKAKVPPPTPDLLPLAIFTMICAQWLILCEYVNTRLGQVEWEIERGLLRLHAQEFDHTLQALLTWRRRMPIYHSFVEKSLSRLSVRYTSKEDVSPFNSWDSIIVNLEDILHRLETLHRRADNIMGVSMAITQREESRKATQESHILTRISYLAFIFVPLGFLASFFSMSADFPLRTYWIYAVIALPVSGCVFVALVFANSISEWWGKFRKERRRWKREKGSREHV